jgi:hypothetical protein
MYVKKDTYDRIFSMKLENEKRTVQSRRADGGHRCFL